MSELIQPHRLVHKSKKLPFAVFDNSDHRLAAFDNLRDARSYAMHKSCDPYHETLGRVTFVVDAQGIVVKFRNGEQVSSHLDSSIHHIAWSVAPRER